MGLAFAFAGQGETDRAFDALERALAAGFDDRPALHENPHLASIRSEPRYAALLRHYGMEP